MRCVVRRGTKKNVYRPFFSFYLPNNLLTNSNPTITTTTCVSLSARQMNKKQIADSEEWAAFTACSYSPRITESELNTYITETNDRPEMSLTESLECLNYTESIIEDLNSRVIKMRSEEVIDEGKVRERKSSGPEVGYLILNPNLNSFRLALDTDRRSAGVRS